MLALRYVAVLALTVWAGGLLALGLVAAPATFDTAAAQQLPDFRLLAGTIFGETLRRFHHVGYACGIVLLLSLAARAVLGPRPRRFALRIAIAIVMLGAMLYSGFVVTPQVERLRDEPGPALSTLPASDPRRVAFGRAHGLSTGLQLVPVIGGLVLLAWELRD
jgi:hypothetical protein